MLCNYALTKYNIEGEGVILNNIVLIIVGIIILVGIFLLIVGIIDGNRFRVVEEEIVMPDIFMDCKFVLISDLHNKLYGKSNESVIASIKSANPDFIIIAGDLVTSKAKESMEPGINLVNALSKEFKIYYGLGNHENKIKLRKEYFGDKYEQLVNAVSNQNVVILDNEKCIDEKHNICVTGLNLNMHYFAHFKINNMNEDYLESELGKSDDTYCNILIAHNPDYFPEYAKWGADLVLSGHVHGGIMRLPILGGVIAPSYKIFPKYDGGIFKEGKATMLLGRGMGSHSLPFRFFNPAELYVVTLKCK